MEEQLEVSTPSGSTPDGSIPEGDGDVALGARRVVAELRQLPRSPELDDALLDRTLLIDANRLADVLLDQRDKLPGIELLRLMTDLLCPVFDGMAESVCNQECWFLNPKKLSEDAVATMYRQLLRGERVRPFIAWAWKVTGEVVRMGADDPSVLLFREDMLEHGSLEAKALIEIGQLCNRMPHQHRQVAWMTWIKRMDVEEISMMTGTPLERVEWIIEDLVERALRVVAERSGTVSDLEAADGDERGAGSDAFWRAMGEGNPDDADGSDSEEEGES